MQVEIARDSADLGEFRIFQGPSGRRMLRSADRRDVVGGAVAEIGAQRLGGSRTNWSKTKPCRRGRAHSPRRYAPSRRPPVIPWRSRDRGQHDPGARVRPTTAIAGSARFRQPRPKNFHSFRARSRSNTGQPSQTTSPPGRARRALRTRTRLLRIRPPRSTHGPIQKSHFFDLNQVRQATLLSWPTRWPENGNLRCIVAFQGEKPYDTGTNCEIGPGPATMLDALDALSGIARRLSDPQAKAPDVLGHVKP